MAYYLLPAPGLIIILAAVFFLMVNFAGRYRNAIILLLCLLLGILRLELAVYYHPCHIRSILADHSQFTRPVQGRIVTEVQGDQSGSFFILELSHIDSTRVIGKIKFHTRQNDFSYGDIIQAVATVSEINRPANPSGFDYSEFLQLKDIHGQGYALGVPRILGNRGSPFQKMIIRIRQRIRDRIENRFPVYKGFVKAILIGDRSELEDWQGNMNRAGLSHLLAVSGLHVGIISLVLMSFLKLVFRHRNLCRLLLIITLWIYAAVCSWSPSVSRAVVMISLFLLAGIMQRKVQSLNILVCTLIVITAVNPLQLFSVGLQLSFLAVFTLLTIVNQAGALFRGLAGRKIPRLLQYLLLLMITSTILNLVLMPLTMLHFNQFNLNGMIANLAGIPITSLILPLVILIVALPPVPAVVTIYSAAGNALIWFLQKWTAFCAGLPLIDRFSPFPPVKFWLSYLFLALAFVKAGKPALQRIKKMIFLLLFLFMILPFSVTRQGDLVVNFFDCGLGDLCLIELPDGEKMMIDCGPTARSRGHFNQSALPYFRQHGISQLDWLIITHAHNDHYGGLSAVLQELTVKRIVVTDDFQKRSVWEEFREAITLEKAEIVTISDTISFALGKAGIRFLHPDASYYDENINNMSIVMRLDLDEFSVFMTGDLEEEGEAYLLQKYPGFLDCDVLKVGHHGSSTSSTPAFINAVSPRIAFISTSLRNRFDFPHPRTLQKYDHLEEGLFISGKDGALRIKSDGSRCSLLSIGTARELVWRE